MFGSIGMPELVIILVIALIILGPGKLPDVGASLGKSIREFRKASSDIQEAATVKVDTSPLPPQAAADQSAQAIAQPIAPVSADPIAVAPVAVAPVAVAPVAVAPVVATPAATADAVPTTAQSPASTDDPAARIAELERQLAESQARLAQPTPVATGSTSGDSGNDASA